MKKYKKILDGIEIGEPEEEDVEEILEYVGHTSDKWRKDFTKEEVEEWIERYFEERMNKRIEIIGKKMEKIVGNFSLKKENSKCRVGIAVREGYRNKGIGASLLQEAIDFAPELDIEALYAEIYKDNKPSYHI